MEMSITASVLVVVVCGCALIEAAWSRRLERRAVQKKYSKYDSTIRRLVDEKNALHRQHKENMQCIEHYRGAVDQQRQEMQRLRDQLCKKRVFDERGQEMLNVLNDGGIRALFRILRAAGIDAHAALKVFDRDEGPLTRSKDEVQALEGPKGRLLGCWGDDAPGG